MIAVSWVELSSPIQGSFHADFVMWIVKSYRKVKGNQIERGGQRKVKRRGREKYRSQ